jgi:two-component system chemotaxis response regulator CheY
MPTALVVDDNTDVRLLARIGLEGDGFEVTEASGGEEALAHLDGGARPDLVVLDVQRPVMTGWEFLETIRGRDDVKEIPVIMCTVKTSPDSKQKGFDLGCDGYVGKPYRVAELVAEVHRVLGNGSQPA